MKNLLHKIHLWLGLISGLLVVVIAFTGAMYAFNDEISSLNSYKHVEVEHKPIVRPSVLQKIAEQQLPGKTLHSIKYNASNKSAEATFYGYEPSYYFIVYLNPYTGDVLKVKNVDRDFFRFMMQGHYYLWLPPAIGHPLVASATLIFFLVIISGLIIWIPKNRKSFGARTRFKWKKTTKWPRINLDLHIVGGLYVSVFALIFATTGLIWGFQWFADSSYWLMGGEKTLQYNDVNPSNKVNVHTTDHAIDKVWNIMKNKYPDVSSIEVHPPHDKKSLIAANANPAEGQYGKTDYLYFDQETLKEVKLNTIWGKTQDMNVGEKIFRMNYDLHTGSILGFPGKLLAFLMSLCIASLPVTGFVIWWRKRK